MYVNSSNRGPKCLLHLAHQQYGISIHSSFYHLTLRNDTFTEQFLNFLLTTFPNVEHLELVQISLDRNFNSCLQLFVGLSGSLKSLAVFHEIDKEIDYWEDASRPNSLGSHPRVWARKRLKELSTAPNRFLSNVSQNDYPNLNHISLIDLTMYSTRTPQIETPPNWSHLESFFYVQPLDETLFKQYFVIQEPWKNLKNLAIESKVLVLPNHFDEICDYDAVQKTLSNLRNLTVSGIFPQVLDHLNACTVNLVYLNIHDLNLRLCELLPKLVDLTSLRTLRVCFDTAIMFSQWTQVKSKQVQLPQIETLQLKNVEVIHQPTHASPVIIRSFPNLRKLLLEPSIAQWGTQCRHCKRVGVRMADLCKQNLIRAFSGGRRGAPPRLEKLESIKVHVNHLYNNPQRDSPQWLEQYEVWSFKEEEWTLETIPF